MDGPGSAHSQTELFKSGTVRLGGGDWKLAKRGGGGKGHDREIPGGQ